MVTAKYVEFEKKEEKRKTASIRVCVCVLTGDKSDGERLANHRDLTRPIRQCSGSKGIRSQQTVEGEIYWLWCGPIKRMLIMPQLEKRIF